MKLITNASLPTSSTALKRVNILFDDKISKISTEEVIDEDIREVIDLKGHLLLPGAIDAHSHIIAEKDPTKNLARISKAAISGGWTTLAEMSYLNPHPVFDLDELTHNKRIISKNTFVDMALWGNVNIDDYPYYADAAQEIWAEGVVGITLMNPSPNDAISALTFTEIMDLFMDIYESDTAFAFQGWDKKSSKKFSFESQRDAIKKILRRMQENPIHIPRIASFDTIEFINSISKRSDISFSMNISDLMETYSGISQELPTDLAKNKEDLFTLLRTNKIYMLSNNVESVSIPAGLSEAFRGTSEELLPYSYLWALSELWKKRRVPLATVIKMTSENAAKRLGIYPDKGCLAAGSDADFVVYDPTQDTIFKAPDGSEHQLAGSIKAVYLRGKKVVDHGKTTTAAGTFLTRKTNPKRRHNKTTWF